MKEWNHSVCDICWDELRPDRAPYRLMDPEPELCCVCGIAHKSGIYVRLNPDDPVLLHCRGEHPD